MEGSGAPGGGPLLPPVVVVVVIYSLHRVVVVMVVMVVEDLGGRAQRPLLSLHLPSPHPLSVWGPWGGMECAEALNQGLVPSL